jgi:hypothetical protein
MNPEMYLVLYHQQERELDERLERQALMTCCTSAPEARRPVRASLSRHVGRFTARFASPRAARQAAVCCPA